MKKHNILLTMLSAALLSACGGSDGGSSSTPDEKDPISSTEPTGVIKGRVIDGYISGATVFLDKNFDGQHNPETEPKTTTDSTGFYDLGIFEYDSCRFHAPIVVKVPVGAIDLDDPDTPITEAYTMTLPPMVATAKNDGSDQDITPLTTQVWNLSKTDLENDLKALNCDGMTAAEEIMISDSVSRSETLVISSSSNIDNSETLYSDFVESGDTNLQKEAQAHVVRLKEAEKENSSTINVFYAKGKSLPAQYQATDDDFYKVTTTTTTNGFITKVQEVSEETLAVFSTLYEEKNEMVKTDRFFAQQVYRLQLENGSPSCSAFLAFNEFDDNGIITVKNNSNLSGSGSQLSQCGNWVLENQYIHKNVYMGDDKYEAKDLFFNSSSGITTGQNAIDLAITSGNFSQLSDAAQETFNAVYDIEFEITPSMGQYDFTNFHSTDFRSIVGTSYWEVVSYGKEGIWTKERQHTSNGTDITNIETFCMNQLSNLDGDAFENEDGSKKDPIEFWHLTYDDNSDDVWLKVSDGVQCVNPDF